MRIVFICLQLGQSSFQTIQARVSPLEYLCGHRRKPRIDSPSGAEDHTISDGLESPLSFRDILTAPVLLATGSYASFSMLDIAFRTMLPVYLSTPIKMGGLGLDPSDIGAILATMGISTSVFQLLFFAPLHDKLGGKNLFLIAVSLFLPMAVLFPFTNLVAQEQGLNYVVWLFLGLQILLFSCAIFALSKPSNSLPMQFENDDHVSIPGTISVYVNFAAPNRASIGATTGFAQMTVSFVRGVGLFAINSAFALGIQSHVMGGHFAYWMMAGMTTIPLVLGAALPRSSSKD